VGKALSGQINCPFHRHNWGGVNPAGGVDFRDPFSLLLNIDDREEIERAAGDIPTEKFLMGDGRPQFACSSHMITTVLRLLRPGSLRTIHRFAIQG
jgi:hypothetical protein